ncbi:MAG: hypothetical protein LBC37_01740, partial [Zoogloeaceae bacterium]|nr:hypothetical protein [Zoogloeaceae bacterium]
MGAAENTREIEGSFQGPLALPSPVRQGTDSADLLRWAQERENVLTAAERNAEELYRARDIWDMQRQMREGSNMPPVLDESRLPMPRPVLDAQRLSEQLGIDPNVGPVSSAAALAVDSGVTQSLTRPDTVFPQQQNNAAGAGTGGKGRAGGTESAPIDVSVPQAGGNTDATTGSQGDSARNSGGDSIGGGNRGTHGVGAGHKRNGNASVGHGLPNSSIVSSEQSSAASERSEVVSPGVGQAGGSIQQENVTNQEARSLSQSANDAGAGTLGNASQNQPEPIQDKGSMAGAENAPEGVENVKPKQRRTGGQGVPGTSAQPTDRTANPGNTGVPGIEASDGTLRSGDGGVREIVPAGVSVADDKVKTTSKGKPRSVKQAPAQVKDTAAPLTQTEGVENAAPAGVASHGLTTTPVASQKVPSGDAQVLTFEQYAAQNGLQDYMESATHNPLGHLPDSNKRRIQDETQKRLDKHRKDSDQLREQYEAEVAAGRIRPPTTLEKRIATAKGHPDNQATQAARRLLLKAGYDESIWLSSEATDTTLQEADSVKPNSKEQENGSESGTNSGTIGAAEKGASATRSTGKSVSGKDSQKTAPDNTGSVSRGELSHATGEGRTGEHGDEGRNTGEADSADAEAGRTGSTGEGRSASLSEEGGAHEERVFTEYRNDPEGAIKRLLEEKTGEARAVVTREGLGEIDLIYGNEKGGLRHIAENHPEILPRLPAILREGELKEIPGNRKRYLITDKTTPEVAVIALDYNGSKKTWVVTAYEDVRGTVSGLAKTMDSGQVASKEGDSLSNRKPDESVADASTDSKTNKIENFGEALPPPFRRRMREVSDEDIENLPLSKIWPKETIGSIKDNGMAALAHILRESIPAK